jgi:hypothetical protein
METDISKNVKWKLKKVNKFWFLDIGGKLKWLNMLDKAIEVFMEENIIFADDIMYQVSEESDGEAIITEVKSINQKDKTLDVKKDNTVFQTEKDINPGAREDLGDILGLPLEGDLDKNIALNWDHSSVVCLFVCQFVRLYVLPSVTKLLLKNTGALSTKFYKNDRSVPSLIVHIIGICFCFNDFCQI